MALKSLMAMHGTEIAALKMLSADSKIVSRGAQQTFEQSVKSLIEKAAAFSDDKTRESTAENCLAEAKELRESLELYRDIAGLAIDDMSEAIKGVESAVNTMLGFD